MPYEYRKLTTEGREKVKRYRREKGYPLHSPPHPFRDAGYYLITAANYEHQPVMANPERRSELEYLLLKAMNEIQAQVIAWVILPNHYHVLIDISDLNLVSFALKHLHGSTSRYWNQEDGMTGKRKNWYKFSDRLIRSEKQLHQVFNYIHYNPVKHGYIDDMYGWHWSSLKMYTDSIGNEWLLQRWISAPPEKELGKGWDE